MDATSYSWRLADLVGRRVRVDCRKCGAGLGTYEVHNDLRRDPEFVTLVHPPKGHDSLGRPDYPLQRSQRAGGWKVGRLHLIYRRGTFHVEWVCGCGATGYRQCDLLGDLPVTRLAGAGGPALSL